MEPRRDPSEKQEPHTVMWGKMKPNNAEVVVCFAPLCTPLGFQTARTTIRNQWLKSLCQKRERFCAVSKVGMQENKPKMQAYLDILQV